MLFLNHSIVFLLLFMMRLTGALLAARPRLIIFDLDRTLCPFGIDEYIYKPPYQVEKSTGKIRDSELKEMKPFPEVTEVLKRLRSEDIELGVASRTTYPEGAYKLLNLFNWDDLIKYREIYPVAKTKQFENLRNKTGIDFDEMMFFDDEERNIVDTRPLGLTAVIVSPETGLTQKVIDAGFDVFVNRQRKKA